MQVLNFRIRMKINHYDIPPRGADLTEQLIATRNQLHELTGEKPNESKSSRATEFYKNNPGLTRKEYISAFLELDFGKAYAATIYQKIKKMNVEVSV